MPTMPKPSLSHLPTERVVVRFAPGERTVWTAMEEVCRDFPISEELNLSEIEDSILDWWASGEGKYLARVYSTLLVLNEDGHVLDAFDIRGHRTHPLLRGDLRDTLTAGGLFVLHLDSDPTAQVAILRTSDASLRRYTALGITHRQPYWVVQTERRTGPTVLFALPID